MDFGNILHTGEDLWNSFVKKDPGGNSNATDLFSLLGTLYGAKKGSDQMGQGSNIIANADPFAEYRPGYGKQLYDLMKDPNSITQDPGYQFQVDQGTTNLERSLGSKGYLGSGNMAAEIQKYGQDYAKTAFNERVAQLSHLSGADIAPSSAASGGQLYDTGLGTVLSAAGQGAYALGRNGTPLTPNGGGSSTPLSNLYDLAKYGFGVDTGGVDQWGLPKDIFGTDMGFDPTGGADTGGMFKDAGSMLSTIAGDGKAILGGLGIGGGAAALAPVDIGATLATYGGAGSAAIAAASGGGAAAGTGATAAGAAAGSGSGMMSTIAAAAPWVAAAIAVAAVAANNMKKSSPLNDSFDINSLTFNKGAHFDNTKFTAQELDSYLGPAMRKFAATGNFSAAMAMIPKPSNAKEATMLKGGAKSLFGGTGNPFRVIAKSKGYGEGPWTAGNSGKKAAIKQASTGGYTQLSDVTIPTIPRKVS